jgi:hypothetical protein
MGLPIGMQYLQQVAGSALKQVMCEFCRTKYFYFAEGRAEGKGSSFRKMAERAKVSNKSPLA